MTTYTVRSLDRLTCGLACGWLRQSLNDGDQFLTSQPMVPSELKQIPRSRDHGAPGGCRARDGDAAPAAELDEPFVSELPKRTEDGIGVDTEDRGQIPGRREPFARPGFAISQSPADLGCHLLVERHGGVWIDSIHDAIYASTMALKVPTAPRPKLLPLR